MSLSRSILTWLIFILSPALGASILRRDVIEQAQQDICMAHSARVALAGNTLYFTGGSYTFKGGDTDSREPKLFSIPLNHSFPADGALPANNYYTTTSPKQWGNQGVFFLDANQTSLYSFGGYIDNKQAPINQLDTYNITSGEWSNVSVSGGDFNHHERVATSQAVTTSSEEAFGFVAGGWDDLAGMIRFDASDPAKPQWRNETDNKPPLTLEGSMEYVRLGPKGSLINLGGYNKDYVNPKLKGWSYDQRPMSQINVYDIDSATWFNVTASGDIPSNRSAFCTVVSSAPDDSSFQITMYGGWDLFGNRSFADTYVLSIPSFQWINVTDASNLDARLASGSGSFGRDHHQCAAYKDRQMLVLGGILRRGGAQLNGRGCDQTLPAIRTLDLSTFEWKADWSGSPEAYFVPDAVTRIIGGSGQGGASLKQPNGGFKDAALNTIFSHVVPRYTPPSLASTAPITSKPKDTSAPVQKSNVAAIAGGVAGGVVALALIAVAAWFLLRRRKREAKARQKPIETGSEGNDPQVVSGSGGRGGGGGFYKPKLGTGEGDAVKPLMGELDGAGEAMRREMDGDYYPPVELAGATHGHRGTDLDRSTERERKGRSELPG